MEWLGLGELVRHVRSTLEGTTYFPLGVASSLIRSDPPTTADQANQPNCLLCFASVGDVARSIPHKNGQNEMTNFFPSRPFEKAKHIARWDHWRSYLDLDHIPYVLATRRWIVTKVSIS